MNESVIHQQQVQVERSSETLWRVWFDAGSAALSEADGLARKPSNASTSADDNCCASEEELRSIKLYRDAAKWFASAARQSTGLAKNRDERLILADAGRAWAFFQIGRLSDAQTAAEKAIQCVAECRELTSELARRYVARTHYVLGDLAFRRNDYTSTENSLGIARRFYGSVEDLTDDDVDANVLDELIRIFSVLGLVHLRTSRFESSVEHFSRAQNLLRRRGKTANEVASILAHEASARIELGQLRSALSLYRRWESLVADGVTKTTDHAEQARIFGYLHLVAGQYNSADELLRLAEGSLRCCGEEPQSLAKLSRYQAMVHLRTGSYRDAYDLLPLKVVGGRQRQLREWFLLGEFHRTLGDFAKSRTCLAQGKRLLDDNSTPASASDRVAIWLGLARLDITQGSFSSGESLARSTIKYLEDKARITHPEMAQALLQVSRVRLLTNKRDAAPICDQALTLLEMSLTGVSADRVEYLTTRAKIHLSRGELEEGLLVCDVAANLLCRARPNDGFAHSRLDTVRAQLFHVKGNLPAARACLTSGWNHWSAKEEDQDHEHPEKSLTMLAVATVFAAYGEYDKAEQLYRLLSKLLLKLKAGKQDNVAYELNWQGDVYFENNRYREAKWLYEQAASNYEQCLGAKQVRTQRAQANARTADAKLLEAGG